MLLDYIARDASVQAAFLVIVGVLVFSAMTYRKTGQSELRQSQRERQRDMLRPPALAKRSGRDGD